MEHKGEQEQSTPTPPARRDRDAFTILYRSHVNGIRAFTYRRCGDPHLADDITAVVFERAWRHFPTVQVPEYGIGPWLYRIAANELASHFRRKSRGERATERLARARGNDAPDPASELELQYDIEVVRVALGQLRTRHQEVIALRYLAGLTPQETAEAMGTTPSVVAAVLHRAIRALERVIEDPRERRRPGGPRPEPDDTGPEDTAADNTAADNTAADREEGGDEE